MFGAQRRSDWGIHLILRQRFPVLVMLRKICELKSVFVMCKKKPPDSSENLQVFVRVCVGCLLERGRVPVLFRKTILSKDEWVNRNH